MHSSDISLKHFGCIYASSFHPSQLPTSTGFSPVLDSSLGVSMGCIPADGRLRPRLPTGCRPSHSPRRTPGAAWEAPAEGGCSMQLDYTAALMRTQLDLEACVEAQPAYRLQHVISCFHQLHIFLAGLDLLRSHVTFWGGGVLSPFQFP